MNNAFPAAALAAVLMLGKPVQAQPAAGNNYHYVLPLDLALESATEAIRLCSSQGYRVTATVIDMDGVPQVALRGDGATVHTAESSFHKAYTVITLGPEFGFDASSGLFELVKTAPTRPGSRPSRMS
jgi:uncharacterized protein GlcG (DUF336 family)